MDDRKIIAVVGATGAQGGGVVPCQFCRTWGAGTGSAPSRGMPAPTRRKICRNWGAEVVEVDIDDVGEPEEGGFHGAHGAFCVTFSGTTFLPRRNWRRRKHMADAAKQAGVRHVIWSTLKIPGVGFPSATRRMPTLMGKYKVPHFDAKGEANRLFSERSLPTTFLLTSFYWENLNLLRDGAKRGEDGKLSCHHAGWATEAPRGSPPGISENALTRFSGEAGNFSAGRLASPGHLTGAGMAAALTKALGAGGRYHAVVPRGLRRLRIPRGGGSRNMFSSNGTVESIFLRSPAARIFQGASIPSECRRSSPGSPENGGPHPDRRRLPGGRRGSDPDVPCSMR